MRSLPAEAAIGLPAALNGRPKLKSTSRFESLFIYIHPRTSFGLHEGQGGRRHGTELG
jgi:hypothetical protein